MASDTVTVVVDTRMTLFVIRAAIAIAAYVPRRWHPRLVDVATSLACRCVRFRMVSP